MRTPLYDYVKKYAQSGVSRLHMPGHKGSPFLGVEHLDITEIKGADSLYDADGIIRQSEENAAALFQTGRTLYSTEGSTQCIKAMLFLAVTAPRAQTGRPFIVAARNVHKSFVQAAALLDFDIVWLWNEQDDFSLCHNSISASQLEKVLSSLERKPSAVYITSPDYLGGMLDIKAFAEISHKHGVPLLVDNAHGAYLKFLKESCHPIELGADLCCDSAHKTLPVLTGGAYLHISDNADSYFAERGRNAMALFGSTSPSYLIMQSLDLANGYLESAYSPKLEECIRKIDQLKKTCRERGWCIFESDPLKFTVETSRSGYTGSQMAEILRKNGIEPEYTDPDYVVLMLTPENKAEDFEKLSRVFESTEVREELTRPCLQMAPPRVAMTVREAVFSHSERISVEEAVGKTLAEATVGCPPAVPVIVSGEVIDRAAVEICKYYGMAFLETVI